MGLEVVWYFQTLRDAGEGSAVDRPIELHSTRIRAVAPRGANFFHIIILQYFHGERRTFVFIQAKLNPAPVVLDAICSAWTTIKAYAHYVDVK